MQYFKDIIWYVVAVFIGMGIGWAVTKDHDEAKANKLATDTAAATLKQSETNRVKESQLQATVDTQAKQINDLEKKANDDILASQAETNKLRTCIANGTCGLRYVNAPACGTGETTGKAAGTGPSNGAPGGLNEPAEQAYFALRDGIAREAEKLKLCQGYIRTTQ